MVLDGVFVLSSSVLLEHFLRFKPSSNFDLIYLSYETGYSSLLKSGFKLS